ncbi:hypothetical protein O6H91_15G063800 [Diphasiastrum complanatum]|uniref:Uncharacterized protein n=2 Tax=Diphasiastrum complanatum TaxID=34168 RepID=A0ACC2BK10_DIPCM|nr:hypothetical protein O6H91_15G063800 [Diphasiastrum complanatum]
MSAIRITSFAGVWPQGELFYNKKDLRIQGSCSVEMSTPFGKQFVSVALAQRKCLRNRRWGLAVAILDKGSSLAASTHKIKTSSLEAFQQLRTSGADRYTSERSSILVLGLSVHTAPVEMREKLALPEAEWPRAIEELCNQNHIEEAAVLSTCNRMEIYVVALSWHRGVREISEWMSKTSGIPIGELREHLFILQNRDATEHLFRVASGLDSLVLGEGQILAQVKQVYKIGQGVVGFGRCLSGLFKQSITAGKRVRSETNIAAGAVSISSAAVELALMKLPEGGLLAAHVLVVGAGKMSKLLIKHLVSKGCCKLVVVNRSEQRVVELQNEFPEAELIYQPLNKLLECAGEADLIFTSTASESPIFLKEEVLSLKSASDAAAGIRCFIDISVPRNVSACVSEISSVQVFNVDDLREVVEANKEERKRKAVEAQLIIEEELKSFEAWRDSLETVPTIKKLRAYAEKVRASELEKCLSKFGDISAKNRKLIDELSRGIVNKLLHGPMQHLRTDTTNTRTVSEIVENMHALERMFDLKLGSASLEQFRSKVEKLSE